MREPLIAMEDIPPDGTVTADLLGREVLVMMQNGKPRAFLNVCMHHGGSLKLEGGHLHVRVAWIHVRRPDGQGPLGTRSARRKADHAADPCRGRRPDLRLRGAIRDVR